MIPTSICAYHKGPIEWDGERWVDSRSGDDGGTFDWCPDSPQITDNEPLQPHKARSLNHCGHDSCAQRKSCIYT